MSINENQKKIILDLLQNNNHYQELCSKLNTEEITKEEFVIQIKALLIKLSKKNEAQSFIFHFPNGITTYLEEITSKEALVTPIINLDGEFDKFQLELAFAYTQDYNEKSFAFTNGIANPEGGMHVTGLKSSLTKLINQYATGKGIFKKDTEKFIYDDIKEGLKLILSIKMVDAQFTSQSKVKLGSTIARTYTEKIVTQRLEIYFEENPTVVGQIISKVFLAMKARLAARAARDNVLRKTGLESTSLPGKLADCSEKNPALCEVFIVEGDSAGGSAKQGRNRSTQAILPLRGKVLNTEKATLDRILNYEGIKNMIIAFGTGVGDKFDIEKLRYHKIILMTDADVDGAHITTLLLTFIYRYLPRLIEDGYVYMARPPLYRIALGKKVSYVYSDQERDSLIKELKAQDPEIQLSGYFEEEVGEENSEQTVEEDLQNQPVEEKVVNPKQRKKKIEIQRYKGLGEMNPDQLWDTTMDPNTRLLYQITIGEAETANRVFEDLMGSDVEPRKRFIGERAEYVVADTI
jgi:DNA gyrase subunit B